MIMISIRIKELLSYLLQIGKSSANFSTLSAKDTIARESSNRWLALYKGLKVAVYSVDKPEISLTRQDLIELVNVRSFYLLII